MPKYRTLGYLRNNGGMNVVRDFWLVQLREKSDVLSECCSFGDQDPSAIFDWTSEAARTPQSSLGTFLFPDFLFLFFHK